MSPSRELIAPVDTNGSFLTGPVVGIDAAHRSALLHRGVWLHVLSSDGALLLVRRSSTMKTCPNTLSIIGEHHSGRELDDDCAARALKEELPGLAPLWPTFRRLRARPRWFLFDYAAAGDRGARFDRCLITEYLVHLSLNQTAALTAIRGSNGNEHELEATEHLFLPMHVVARMLRRAPDQFCAQEHLPHALLDTVADICFLIHCGSPLGARAAWRAAIPAMPETFDPSRVVRGAAALSGGVRQPGRWLRAHDLELRL